MALLKEANVPAPLWSRSRCRRLLHRLRRWRLCWKALLEEAETPAPLVEKVKAPALCAGAAAGWGRGGGAAVEHGRWL